MRKRLGKFGELVVRLGAEFGGIEFEQDTHVDLRQLLLDDDLGELLALLHLEPARRQAVEKLCVLVGKAGLADASLQGLLRLQVLEDFLCAAILCHARCRHGQRQCDEAQGHAFQNSFHVPLHEPG